MVSFNEAHVLTGYKIPNDSEEKGTYDVLCLSFNFFLAFPISVICLSTTSNMSQLAPLGSLARSARACRYADRLQVPITETPFDCSPMLPIRPGKLLLKDVSEIEFLAQFVDKPFVM
jgi:hypothetical protein